MYFSAKEILAQLDGTDMRICDLVIKNETEISEISREEIFSMLEERYQIMYNSAHDALEKEIRSLSGLTGGSAKKMWEYYKKGSSICDNTIIRGAAYALSCLEVNASMGLIVAAPTAGACGILPGSLLTVAEKYDIPHQQVLESSCNRFRYRSANCKKSYRFGCRRRMSGRMRKRCFDGCCCNR